MDERDEIDRLQEQLANFQAVVRAREDRIAVLTAKIKGDMRPIQPGEPGYDDEHGDQGKQEDRLADSERGRAFLERIYGADQGDRDCYEAAGALYGVLAYGADQIEPSDVSDSSAAALGRVLREST